MLQLYENSSQTAIKLQERLRRAEAAVCALTPSVGRGRKQCREETSLQAGVQAILKRYDVVDLLRVTWERQEQQQTSYVGPGRGGSKRTTRTVIQTLSNHEGHSGVGAHRSVTTAVGLACPGDKHSQGALQFGDFRVILS